MRQQNRDGLVMSMALSVEAILKAFPLKAATELNGQGASHLKRTEEHARNEAHVNVQPTAVDRIHQALYRQIIMFKSESTFVS